MEPNPQAALPFPPQAGVRQYESFAEELLSAGKSFDPNAIRSWCTSWIRSLGDGTWRVDNWIREVADYAESTLRNRSGLSDSQFVIARSHGFSDWNGLIKHIQALSHSESNEAQFEAAIDAIVNGDIQQLRQLLDANSGLVRMRSAREHNATLLHYVSANGVEGYRQKTPANIVEIAGLLLNAGADVNAGANVYGSQCTTLGLVATSVHPQQAGVQRALMQLLLGHGASMDQPGLAGRTSSLVRACFANGQPDAAIFLADRGAPLDLETAAGVGRIELVKSFFAADGSLQAPATQRQLQNGFLLACMRGEENVANFLLEHGANIQDSADTGATPLHWAAGAGHLGLVKDLLRREAALEILNQWGGTVLEHAGHGFQHGPFDVDFVPTFEILLAAGAKIRGSWFDWIQNVNSRTEDEKARLATLIRKYSSTSA